MNITQLHYDMFRSDFTYFGLHTHFRITYLQWGIYFLKEMLQTNYKSLNFSFYYFCTPEGKMNITMQRRLQLLRRKPEKLNDNSHNTVFRRFP